MPTACQSHLLEEPQLKTKLRLDHVPITHINSDIILLSQQFASHPPSRHPLPRRPRPRRGARVAALALRGFGQALEGAGRALQRRAGRVSAETPETAWAG